MAEDRDIQEITRLGDLSSVQWRIGHRRVAGLVVRRLGHAPLYAGALPFVAELLAADVKDPQVGTYGSVIQASFLVGWALGGGFFGRIGDRLGAAAP